MKCKNCKNELPEGIKFCGKCGQKAEVATKAVSKKKKAKINLY